MYKGVTSPQKLSAAPTHGDPEPVPLAVALEDRVSHLWWLVSRDAPSVISRSAAATMARLREGGPQRISALAAGEAVSQPTMTCLVQRLERDALVSREDDPDDARAFRISITAAGLHALDARAALRADVLSRRFERLDEAQRAALAAALPVLDALLAAGEAA
jgi:DNA-binding MarR family transcriptional regulator